MECKRFRTLNFPIVYPPFLVMYDWSEAPNSGPPTSRTHSATSPEHTQQAQSKHTFSKNLHNLQFSHRFHHGALPPYQSVLVLAVCHGMLRCTQPLQMTIRMTRNRTVSLFDELVNGLAWIENLCGSRLFDELVNG